MTRLTSSATSAAAYVTIARGTPFRSPKTACYLGRFDPDGGLAEIERHAGAVTALARALDAKDPETARHSVRVGRLAQAIARAMGLHAGFQRALRLAGELHDVGKIGVPDDLLRRPGRLSPEEHREVLRHTVIGERILSPLLPDDVVVLGTVRSHHERFDGTGFPDGLRGSDIPLAARIVAVADAFDAMTSARPYRRSLGRAAALRELRRSVGTQFDPLCVGGLLRALRSTRRGGRRIEVRRRAEPRSPGRVLSPAVTGPREGQRYLVAARRRSRSPTTGLLLLEGRRLLAEPP